ncbi:slipin family protein [Desulfonatronovibrio hydrogenovorans]|uniref:slipin family protein n=1 Tax=Desulfonatronovibrio hydrogenovorans TaxID=53245 RepID=UPI00048C83E9|nr:slipin family protein [Desulfonatronovibrio hydrogenovorans]
MLTYALPIVILVVLFLMNAIRILNEYERAVVFRLGRFLSVKGPGLIILIPVLDKMVRTQLRIVTLDVPHQEVITQDNVSIKVSAVVYYRIVEPRSSILEVEDFHYATSQLSQTTLRSVCGAAELDEILSQRDKLNAKIQSIIDDQTDAWGVKVTSVEIKYIDLPQEMQRAMARQAEAERERRAKVIAAEGEYQAAAKLADAAKIISDYPAALQLRYLQTMLQMTSQASNSTVIPIPIDMFNSLKSVMTAAPAYETQAADRES